MQILAPLWIPLGGRSLQLCHTSLDFRQSQKRTSGLARACSVITEFFSSRKASFFPNDRINAKQPVPKKKILGAMRSSCLKSNDLFRSELCNGELRVCLDWKYLRQVYWHLDTCVSWVLLLVNWSLTNQALRDWTWRTGGQLSLQDTLQARFRRTKWSWKSW